ncbi:hypothetical protein CALCODRAFT_481392 [Calocera cornea HHB12733]|uniref:Uncharacterized protein n=1 Tax=Calocera cornea HHB12733 TaxID=1353952 RepID=A0A165HST6_9BASI|nr:hypothetical protein CALCODRAFT_481392 [Calocera cornea HHB12733]
MFTGKAWSEAAWWWLRDKPMTARTREVRIRSPPRVTWLRFFSFKASLFGPASRNWKPSHERYALTTSTMGRRASKSPGPSLPILVLTTTGVLAAAVVVLAAAAALPASAPAFAPASAPARSPAIAALAAAPSRLRTSIWRASASSRRGTVDHCRPPRLPPSRRAVPVGVRI